MAAFAASSLFLSSPKLLFFSHRPLQSPSLNLHISLPHSPFSPQLLPLSARILPFRLFSTVSVQQSPLEGTQQETPDEKTGRIYVFNLPWDFTATDIKNLFSQCGTVKDVEVLLRTSCFCFFIGYCSQLCSFLMWFCSLSFFFNFIRL